MPPTLQRKKSLNQVIGLFTDGILLFGRLIKLQVYGYARRFAKIGIANALVDSLHGGLNSAGLVSASIALKAVAVNVSFQIWLESKKGIRFH